MHVRDVVAAVEVVVDEHFPIAVDGVVAPLHPVQIAEAEPGQLPQQLDPRYCSREGPPASALANTHCSATAQSTGTRPFAERSKSHTPAKSGVPLSVPSSP